MNYITKLQQQVKTLEEQKEAAQQQLTDLKAYLTSEKFSCGSELDRYVSTQDVLTRLAEIESALRS